MVRNQQVDHESNHKAIRVHYVADTTECEEKRRKHMYDKADWKRIHIEVSTMIADDSRIYALSSKDEPELAVGRLKVAINGVSEEHVAQARPSLYAKRWRTDELKMLRSSLNATRN